MNHRRMISEAEPAEAWAELDRQWRRQRRHRMWTRGGDLWEEVKFLAAVMALPVVALGMLAFALWTIGEAGRRWLAVPVGIALVVMVLIVWRLARRRGTRRG